MAAKLNTLLGLPLLVLGPVACELSTPPQTTASAVPEVSVSAVPVAPVNEDAASTCEPAHPLERVELETRSAITLASGLEVHFVGTSEDLYEDGSSDLLAEFRFGWGADANSELVSALSPATEQTLGTALDHCWRLVELRDGAAILDVALASSASGTLDRCVAPMALPVFERFSDASEGARFQATLRYDAAAHAWSVVPAPEILLHHASRIEWSNLAAFGRAGLGKARDQDVRVGFFLESIEITKVADQHLWLSKYVATIESACQL